MGFFRKKIDDLEKNIEIAPEIKVGEDSINWFINNMFNPEDPIWILIHKIADILVFVILIIVIISIFV